MAASKRRTASPPSSDELRLDDAAVARCLSGAKARGITSHEGFRYAVHEACHALDLGLALPWSGLRVHEALSRLDAQRVLNFELKARAVEAVVTEAAGQREMTLEEAAAMTSLEAATSGMNVPYGPFLDALRVAVQHDSVRAAAAVVVAALSEPLANHGETRQP